MNLWEKQKEIVKAVLSNREVAVKSCNASGKTFTSACLVHWWLTCFRNSVVITTSPTIRQVREVLWREIRAIIPPGYYGKDDVLETKINIDQKWFALGIATDQEDQFQGIHSEHLFVIIDEASGVDDKIFRAIDGLKPEKILMLGNPLRNTGRFANAFKDAGIYKISISAFETPNVIEKRVIVNGLITFEDIERFKRIYGEDSDVYRVRVLGEFPKAETDTFISVDEVVKAINREAQSLEVPKKMGVDPARYGDDLTAIVIRQDKKVIKKELFSNKDTMEIAGLIIKIAKEEGIKPEFIYLDNIGIGAGIEDRLKELGFFINGVNVALPAKNSEQYLNLRVELLAEVKEWLKEGQLTKDEDWYELCNPKYSFTSKGQLKLESKEEMRKRGIKSPNLGDALALTFYQRKITNGVWQQNINKNYEYF